MNQCKNFTELEEIFKNYDTKHLPVVDRMIIDINRRLLKEKSLSLPTFDQSKTEKLFFSYKSPRKDSQRHLSQRKSLDTNEKRKLYPSLGEFYIRLNQDLQKRRVKSKIRQQIKKILDKQKESLEINRNKNLPKPHLPHKYANEEHEIEKLYGLPGDPSKMSYKN